jgi:WD40 repeat protein
MTSSSSEGYSLTAVLREEPHADSFLVTGCAPELLAVDDSAAAPTSYDRAKALSKPSAGSNQFVTFRATIKSSGYGSAPPKKPSWAAAPRGAKPPARASNSSSSSSEPVSYTEGALPAAEPSDKAWGIFSNTTGSGGSRPSSRDSGGGGGLVGAPGSAGNSLPLEGAIRSIALSHDGGEAAISTQAGSIACMRLVCKAAGSAGVVVVKAAASPGAAGTTGPLSKLWAKKLLMTPSSFSSAALGSGSGSSRGTGSSRSSSSSSGAFNGRPIAGSASAGVDVSVMEWPVCTSLSWASSAVDALKTATTAAGAPGHKAGKLSSVRSSSSSSSSSTSRSLADVLGSGDDGGDIGDVTGELLPPAIAAASAASMTPRLLLGCGSSKEACVWLSYGNHNHPVVVIRHQEGGDMRNEWRQGSGAAGTLPASLPGTLFPSTVTSGCFYFQDRFILLACGGAVSAYTYNLDIEALKGSGSAASGGEEDLVRLKRSQQPRTTYSRVAWWQASPEGTSVTSLVAHNTFLSPLISVACSDRSVRVFDTAVGGATPVEVLSLLEAHDRPIHTLTLPQSSPFTASSAALTDSLITASTESGGTIKLWDLRSAKAVRVLNGSHVNRVHSVGASLSADGYYMATGSEDRAAVIYDLRRGSEGGAVMKLKGATDTVTAVAFHPQTPALFTGSIDGCVRLYQTNC